MVTYTDIWDMLSDMYDKLCCNIFEIDSEINLGSISTVIVATQIDIHGAMHISDIFSDTYDMLYCNMFEIDSEIHPESISTVMAATHIDIHGDIHRHLGNFC